MKTTRRDFLRAAVAAPAIVALSPRVPGFLARAAAVAGGRPDAGNVLVALQLTGGNDGLNTVVPFADDAYIRARPTLHLPADKVLGIDGSFGLHPEMGALRRALDAGHAVFVHGVGHAGSSRDHGEALREWQTARPGSPCETGWAGRAADGAGEEGGTRAVFAGEIDRPFGLNGARAFVPSARAAEDLALGRIPGGDGSAADEVARLADAPRRGMSPLLEDARRAARDAAEASRRILAAAGGLPAGSRGYPDFGLARDLDAAARLIRADVGIRIFFVELGGGGLGGFDNHAGQAANHGALLRQLSDSVAAFLSDLKADGLLDRLLLLTFSEFGRTLVENGRHGTDHGAAQPILLAGGKVKPGLHGRHPSLTDLDGGGLRPAIDFRRVLATALGWIGSDAAGVLGGTYEPLDALA